MTRLIIQIVPHYDGEHYSVDMAPEGDPARGTTRIYETRNEAAGVAISTFFAVADCGMPVEIRGYYAGNARRHGNQKSAYFDAKTFHRVFSKEA